MSDNFFSTQRVATEGYEIVTPKYIYPKVFNNVIQTELEQKIESGLIKPEPSIIAKGEMAKFYNPFEETALFRIFSELDGNHEDIISFASKYGFLGDGVNVESNSNQIFQHAETLSKWKNHIQHMKSAVSLCDHIQNKDTDWLASRIEWEADKSDPSKLFRVIFHNDNIEGLKSKEQIASVDNHSALFERLDFGSTILPAQISLQRLINEHLKGNVSPILLFDKDWGEQKTSLVPKNLISLMWLQLSLAYENNFKFRWCVICSTPFQVDPSERGKPRQFCSAACKAKSYREAKKAKSNE